MKRLICLFTALTLALSLSAAAVPLPDEAGGSFAPAVSAEEWEVLRLTNLERMKEGEAPMSMCDSLHRAARTRADELTESYRPDHTRPDGSSCFTVLDDVSLTDWNVVGENIAQGQRSPAEVVAAWMGSAGHRANILNKKFTHMGAGFDGVYSWEQFFLGSCTPKPEKILAEAGSHPAGTAIDELGAVLVLACAHGTSYLPITAGMCQGYDPEQLGEQTVTVSYGGKSLEFTVTLAGDYGYSYTARSAAAELYALGLFQGKGKLADGSPDFALDDPCTRQEALVLLLRLLGRESAVTQADAAAHPFTDVDPWASAYVGYAYQNGITQGAGAATFNGGAAAAASQGITFVLRALGYASGADFAWDSPWTLSDEIGLTLGQYGAGSAAALTRGEMALLCRAALDCRMANGSGTLRQDLTARGVISG